MKNSEVITRNRFGAKVFTNRLCIDIANRKSLTQIQEKILSNTTITKLSTFESWLKLAILTIEKISDKNHHINSSVYLEENESYFFITIVNLPTESREFYNSLLQNLELNHIKFMGYIFNRRKGAISFYIQKEHKCLIITTPQNENCSLNKILRETIANKQDCAKKYIQESGLEQEDIEELRHLEQECIEQLQNAITTTEQLHLYSAFFNSYAAAIGKLVEFNNLQVGIQESSNLLTELSIMQAEQQEQALIFANFLMQDLQAWRANIFELQNVENIHYLDAALLANCMQFALLLKPKDQQIGSGLEFF